MTKSLLLNLFTGNVLGQWQLELETYLFYNFISYDRRVQETELTQIMTVRLRKITIKLIYG